MSTAMLNVDGSDDPSYRYKMPRLVSKVEGRGNGVKTVLVNCSDVASSLHRSTAQLTKFFGCELGAMTKYEEKIERCLVNGAFDNRVLQEALTGYIAKFVLCPACNNPETVQQLKGKKKAAVVLLNCKACGAVEPADAQHKLNTFIVKEVTAVKEEKKAAKKTKSKDKEKEKEKKREKKAKKTKSRESKDKDSSSPVEDDNEVSSEVSDDFGEFSSFNNIDTVVGQLASSVSTLDVNSTTSLALTEAEKVPAMFFAIVNAQTPLQLIPTKLPVLKGLHPKEVELLLCLEESVVRQPVGADRDNVRKRVPVVLQVLYDNDLLEEQMIMKWFNGQINDPEYAHKRVVMDPEELRKIKEAAEPIVTWLKEAEEAGSDSEEEEE